MSLSPMMKHYLQLKEKYNDCIIFYRLGDFYEMFFDDAVKASSILDLTLTGRDCGLKERAPMCGVPFHAADFYIEKLVSAGEKVAICEQLSEPKKGELVQRDIIKVVTAGTLTNVELMDDKTNNFICSIYIDNGNIGLAWADITTGEFFAKNIYGDMSYINLFNLLVKIAPAEIIANKKAVDMINETNYVRQNVIPKANFYIESAYNYENALSFIQNQFNILSLSGFNIKDNDCCINSCGALLSYLKDTQKMVLVNINTITLLDEKDYMMLDQNVIRNLELVKTLRDGKRYGTLLWLLDKTKTSMGARMLQNWILSPLNDIDKINYRLNGVEKFFNNTLIRKNITDLLCRVKDVGRLSGKIANGSLQAKDCISLLNSLEVLPTVKFQLSGMDSEIINDIIGGLNDYSDICKLLSVAIFDEGKNRDENEPVYKYINTGFNEELDNLRKYKENGVSAILEMEKAEKERTGIRTLKITYNRIFGYCIEVSNSFKDKVPYDYERRQTLANSEKFVTKELKELEIKILSASENAEKLELEIFNKIKMQLANKVSEIKKTADCIAQLDVLLALSNVARENNYVKPVILNSGKNIKITDGRHPVVEATSKNKFIPNDCLLDNNENRTMIITGPNMAGKSTFMRQTAIITILAHIGSFVPATYAEIPLTDKIFTRIGASDNLISDQSTFMVEMSETADILKNATKNSLIILDEIGRGTSTFDGLSIAWAVLEQITTKIKAKTLFATHFHELTSLEGVLEGVKNYKITVKELNGTVIFLRKILRGGANRSFGIEVAELAGVNKQVTTRAKEILKDLEKHDILKDNSSIYEETIQKPSEIERIIKDLDINTLSPMQAFTILSDLCEKVKEDK